MKRIRVITGIVFLLISTMAGAQKTAGVSAKYFIEPYPLKITDNKTTNLVFPAAIRSVDRGSADVLTQKAKGVEHILLLKAGRAGFQETNLSVVTADGKLYSFLLNYCRNPHQLNVVLADEVDASRGGAGQGAVKIHRSIPATAESIAGRQSMRQGSRVRKQGMELCLNGLYIDEDILYFRLSIQNRSNVRFDPDLFSFSIRDRKRAKRTAEQEVALTPLYVYGDTTAIGGSATHTLVVALPKFTLPARKFLSIRLTENNGGRHMNLKVPGRAVLGAQLFP